MAMGEAIMVLMRPLAAVIAVCVVVFLGLVERSAAQPSAITCTNTASGASWQIRIDYDSSTVDSNPAQISASEISWHDARDGATYTLDRKSGNLKAVVASSTGGYFLFHRCKPETVG